MNRPRLSLETLAALPAGVERPAYDPAATRIGVVHFGPGAFHRAHQAVVLDEVLSRQPDWAVSAVALRSPATRDALASQDGLYTLQVLDHAPRTRVVGALRELLVAPESPMAVLARLADPAVRIVTLTVTEKGYHLADDGTLDLDHPDIRADLRDGGIPVTATGWLVAGLAARRRAGLRPFTAISCDNLTDNGGKLAAAVTAFARVRDPGLADWIAAEGAFPATMVDSITPATDDALRRRVAATLGLEDRWPVQREGFSQWVIEDRFADGRPDLAAAGVVLTRDVSAFDRAKLRLLNGPHSSLAYLGGLAGLDTVADAMADPVLSRFVETLMREDIRPTVAPPPGLDLDRYIADILDRFRNPAIRHRLAQIAWDGTRKLPFRLIGTLADALAARRPVARLCLPIAAWMVSVRQSARQGTPIIDPLAERLADIGRACTGSPVDDVPAFLALRGVFPPPVAADPVVRSAISRAYGALGDGHAAAVRIAMGGC